MEKPQIQKVERRVIETRAHANDTNGKHMWYHFTIALYKLLCPYSCIEFATATVGCVRSSVTTSLGWDVGQSEHCEMLFAPHQRWTCHDANQVNQKVSRCCLWEIGNCLACTRLELCDKMHISAFLLFCWSAIRATGTSSVLQHFLQRHTSSYLVNCARTSRACR